MRIQLEQIQDRPFQWQETVRFLREEAGLDVTDGPIEAQVAGRIVAVDDGFHLHLNIAGKVSLRCDFCLESFNWPLEQDNDYLVVVDVDQSVPEEMELEEEDFGFVHVDEPMLDTDPLVRDQLQLALPMSPRCQNNCAGLCPRCGANRNHGSCDCTTPMDPRWQALADLK